MAPSKVLVTLELDSDDTQAIASFLNRDLVIAPADQVSQELHAPTLRFVIDRARELFSSKTFHFDPHHTARGFIDAMASEAYRIEKLRVG